MVRRDAEKLGVVRVQFACCAFLMGGSPIPVSVGAPGSRVAVSGRDPGAEADRQEPLRGERPYGPQHEVKSAASLDKQSGSRAAHFTAKTILDAQVPKRASGPGGVWDVARTEGKVRNTRDPSSLPLSRHACSYKSKTKSSGAERESEGIVVVMIRAQQNARGAKGPYFGCVGRGVTYEGMAGHRSGPTTPGGASRRMSS